MKTLSHRDEAERCLERLYDGQMEAERAAEAARQTFLFHADAATSDDVPPAERVRVAALARRLGVPRGTLLARLEAYRSGKNDRSGAT